MHPQRVRSSAALLFVALLQSITSGQDWPQWRGPNRDGVAPAFTAPGGWPPALRQRWKVTVGIGYSSPVVAGMRVYVLSRQDERETVSSLDLASGKVLWQDSQPAPYQVNPAAAAHGKGPKSTPVVSGGSVFTLGISGILSCLDAQTGKVRWRKTFADRFPQASALYGTAMSPLVDNGLVIAHVGGPARGALTAFDASTGAVRWSWDGDGPGYASPVVFTAGGVRQIVTQTERFIVGVAAASGDLLWKVPFTTEFDQNSVTPVIYKDTLIVSGVAKGMQALRPVKRGAVWEATRAWENPGPSMYMSTPVVRGDLLFGLSHKNKGQIVCLNAITGVTQWTTEGRQGDNAAIVAAGELLFVLTSEAQLIVAHANAEAFDPVRRYDVADSPTWAHPVALNDGFLIKDESTLAFWER